MTTITKTHIRKAHNLLLEYKAAATIRPDLKWEHILALDTHPSKPISPMISLIIGPAEGLEGEWFSEVGVDEGIELKRFETVSGACNFLTLIMNNDWEELEGHFCGFADD